MNITKIIYASSGFCFCMSGLLLQALISIMSVTTTKIKWQKLQSLSFIIHKNILSPTSGGINVATTIRSTTSYPFMCVNNMYFLKIILWQRWFFNIHHIVPYVTECESCVSSHNQWHSVNMSIFHFSIKQSN